MYISRETAFAVNKTKPLHGEPAGWGHRLISRFSLPAQPGETTWVQGSGPRGLLGTHGKNVQGRPLLYQLLWLICLMGWDHAEPHGRSN